MMERTKQRIRDWAFTYKAPVVLWSSGKDSMAMLHLIRSMGFRWPVIFHRHPWMPEKNAFADEIIQKWQLEVHDYPPAQCGVQSTDTDIEIVGTYQVGPNMGIDLPVGVLEPETDGPFLCGRFDVLGRPKGSFIYPWDIMFMGQRSVENDPIMGHLELNTDLHQHELHGAPAVAFPLKEWDEDDVWDYLEQNEVPYSEKRYDITHRVEWKDKRFNPDWYPMCTKCIDKRQPAMVFCPKLQTDIPNISDTVRDVKQTYAYF